MEKQRILITKKHRTVLRNSEISYYSSCGSYVVNDPDGCEIGTIFFYAYLRTDIADTSKRPVLFAYNGGPGASCFWLHLGALAPKRVKTEWIFNGQSAPEDDLLEENPDCPLDVCDIVFIDPMGTGYGKIINREAAEAYFNPETDAAVTAAFIENWLLENNRLGSPVYLAGESYGAIRSALVVSALTGGPFLPAKKVQGTTVSGIVILGNSIIAEPTNGFFSEKGLPFSVQILPTAAATHWYYQESKDCSLAERIEETEAFIQNTYLKALYMGNRMPEEERKDAAQQLSALTGISAEWLIHHQLKFDSTFFRNTYFAEKGMVMSQYDTRFLQRQGTEIDPTADDAVLAKLVPYFLKGLLQYEKELGIDRKDAYIYTDFVQAMGWNFSAANTPFEHLQAALDRNRQLRVFFANGVYDFRAEAGQAVYAAGKLQTEEGQVLVKNYPSGHMAYIGKESAKMFGDDLRSFLTKGV